MSQLFREPEAHEDGLKSRGMADQAMGSRGNNGRYKMPPLPGGTDSVPRSIPAGCDPWVSGGLQSMTNLASSISDTRALGIWEMEQVLIGLARDMSANPGSVTIASHLFDTVIAAEMNGVDFTTVKNYPALRTELADIAERAKDVSGANSARDAGIYRHDIWEAYGKSGGQLFTGTAQVNVEIQAVRDLLDAAGFEIVPDLCERTVRNLRVQAAGRLDNVIMYRKTGRFYMADLKTKAKPFWSFMEIDAQLAGYANSEWMLRFNEATGEITYEEGPHSHVDLQEGVVLHMPSKPAEDGSWEPRLRRADLVAGWRNLQLARQVCEARSFGRSAGRLAASYWPVG